MGGGPTKDVVLVRLPMPEPKPELIKLRSHHPHLDIRFQQDSSEDKKPDEKEQKKIFQDVTVLFTLYSVPTKAEYAPKLDYIQLLSAGSNQIATTPIYKDTDITIATASGVHGPQIAEWVIMTSLIHSHNYNALYEKQKRHQWGKPYSSAVRDKVGQRLGVLGYGSIGRQVGRVAKAMGMDVIAFTATPKKTPESRKDRGFIVPGTGDPDGEIPSAWYSGLDKENLRSFLAQDIDVLLVSVPLTDDTRGFLGTPEFEALSHKGKTKPLLVNIARGPIVKQDELITALKDGTLGTAALDVTDPEPLPEDSELWDLPNAIVTPHVSGNGSSYAERVFLLFDQQLTRREKGEKLINVVQRKRGY